MDPLARGGVRRYLDTVKPEEYVPNVGEVNLQEMTLTGLADLYGSDKGTLKHNYTVQYEKIINELLAGRSRKTTNLSICEAGVACGASLRMWGNYLPASKIIGYDIREECAELCKDMTNVHIRIEDLCKNTFTEPVDLFIDDASHISEHMAAMFNNTWGAVRSGGYYVIEDLACTYNPAYTEQFRKHFDPEVKNNRLAIAALLDGLMRMVDSRENVIRIAEIRYYPQMLVLRKL
jgi:8-demethyl-8-alpha-L-rhamnosyltetracenomycin-C 2'-O-methyltransferase